MKSVHSVWLLFGAVDRDVEELVQLRKEIMHRLARRESFSTKIVAVGGIEKGMKHLGTFGGVMFLYDESQGRFYQAQRDRRTTLAGSSKLFSFAVELEPHDSEWPHLLELLRKLYEEKVGRKMPRKTFPKSA